MSHKDFTAIDTHWGVMYLHHSRTVWYTRYDYDSDGKERDCWMAYRSGVNWPSATPWCQDGSRIGSQVLNEADAIKLCLDHYNKMELVRSGKFEYKYK